MKKGRISTGIIEYPHLGYDLLCFDGKYMFLGERGQLRIEPRNVAFGGHLLEAGISKVVQLGKECRNAANKYLKLYPGSHLLYLGVVRAAIGELIVFTAFQDDSPKEFPRNERGLTADDYINLYVAFHYTKTGDLMVSTRCGTVRVLSSYIEFLAEQSAAAEA